MQGLDAYEAAYISTTEGMERIMALHTLGGRDVSRFVCV